jgi:predicted histone-like DNA-binding protein
MALKVKAREKKLKFSKESEGEWRYVMQPELYSSLTQSKVIREAALRSGVSEGVMQACWDAAGEVIKAWLPEGHSIPLSGLGTCRFGLSASSVDDVNKVKTSLIKTRRIIFTPAVELKDELKATPVVITCYDRDGNEVKRVTSADNAEIDDGTASTDPNQGGENNGGGNTGGNDGGGDDGGGGLSEG